MAHRLSRRDLATYVADQWINGADRAKLIRQLAAYLVESRRTNEAILVVRDIETALAERGQILARVTSAHPLSGSMANEISKQLKTDRGAKSVEIETSVDPSLLGGVKIETPGHELDGSLYRRLKAIKLRTLEQQ